MINIGNAKDRESKIIYQKINKMFNIFKIKIAYNDFKLFHYKRFLLIYYSFSITKFHYINYLLIN